MPKGELDAVLGGFTVALREHLKGTGSRVTTSTAHEQAIAVRARYPGEKPAEPDYWDSFQAMMTVTKVDGVYYHKVYLSTGHRELDISDPGVLERVLRSSDLLRAVVDSPGFIK